MGLPPGDSCERRSTAAGIPSAVEGHSGIVPKDTRGLSRIQGGKKRTSSKLVCLVCVGCSAQFF